MVSSSVGIAGAVNAEHAAKADHNRLVKKQQAAAERGDVYEAVQWAKLDAERQTLRDIRRLLICTDTSDQPDGYWRGIRYALSVVDGRLITTGLDHD